MARVVFTESAFKHGYVEEDFYELLAGRCLRTRSQRGLEAAYELLGRNLTGDYLFSVYRVLPDGRWRVFHMSRMTETQRRRYQKRIK